MCGYSGASRFQSSDRQCAGHPSTTVAIHHTWHLFCRWKMWTFCAKHRLWLGPVQCDAGRFSMGCIWSVSIVRLLILDPKYKILFFLIPSRIEIVWCPFHCWNSNKPYWFYATRMISITWWPKSLYWPPIIIVVYHDFVLKLCSKWYRKFSATLARDNIMDRNIFMAGWRRYSKR